MSIEDPHMAAETVQVDRPVGVGGDQEIQWGSDALAASLRALGTEFVALNPGASYRGLHDSLVNYLGNDTPAMLVCLHEEHAVALAHGYSKVTGKPMAAAVHSNVGLMHATMAIYNAFCDRVPILILGAQGPLDADLRRPWIDWVHTVADPGAMIRDYTKWDDEPKSVQAAVRSIARAHQVTQTYPSAPTFVSFDATLQEQPLTVPPRLPDVERTGVPEPPGPSRKVTGQAAGILVDSERTAMLVGRVGASVEAWESRVELARALHAQVITDTKLRASFPTNDPHHLATPSAHLSESALAVLHSATAVLSLDWVDLAGTMQIAFGGSPQIPVIHCSMDQVLHNGWTKDHFELPEVDLFIEAHPDALVTELLEAGVAAGSDDRGWPVHAPDRTPREDVGSITVRGLAGTMRRVLADEDISLLRVPLAWDGADLNICGPFDYLGQDGGAGLGSGPGMSVGAALALRNSGKLPVAILGDGDFLMGASALWTAARHRIPLLVLVANNRSYYNDEMHQERVARERSRPVENRWVGQHIRDPAPDLASLARSLGLTGYGPVSSPSELEAVLLEAVRAVRLGAAAVVDIHVEVAEYQIVPGIGGRGQAG